MKSFRKSIAAILVSSIIAGSVYSQSRSEIDLKKISTSERAKICRETESALNSVIYSHPFNLAAGYEVAQIAVAGNWNFGIFSEGGSCFIKFDVQGQYRGNSYSRTVVCVIGSVMQKPNGKYAVVHTGIGGGFDEGCRAG
jgi:hypothetical protein